MQARLLSQEELASPEFTEFLPKQSRDSLDLTEMQRHEKFSKALDLPSSVLQQCLEFTQTHTRLDLLHDELAGGRGYLAARNSLKDLF